jgi:hypothetical protein
MAHSPPDSPFFGRPQMTSPARIEDLSKAMGDVNEVVAAIAIASTLDQDEALHRSEMEAGKAVLPLLGEAGESHWRCRVGVPLPPLPAGLGRRQLQ